MERGTEEHLTAPAEKLQGEDDDDTDTVTETLKSAVRVGQHFLNILNVDLKKLNDYR